MPELPEITRLAEQIDQYLTGCSIVAMEILQPKSLNISEADFRQALTGAKILKATNRGKWVTIETDCGWLLLNLGMGGEVLLTDRAHLPEKYRLIFDLDTGKALAINFWWFGYVHFLPLADLEKHPMVSKLGPNALAVSPSDFHQRVHASRGSVKAFLLDQSKIAGIGNAYVHDILFLAHLHPLRRLDGLSDNEIDGLYAAIHSVLEDSISKGAAFYEMDLFGRKGGYTMEDVIIGYREGTACPVCGTPIEKIKTGSTSSFVCPHCQPLSR